MKSSIDGTHQYAMKYNDWQQFFRLTYKRIGPQSAQIFPVTSSHFNNFYEFLIHCLFKISDCATVFLCVLFKTSVKTSVLQT